MPDNPTVEVEIRARLDKLEADLARARTRLNTFDKSGRAGVGAARELEAASSKASVAMRNLANELAVIQGPLGPIAGRFGSLAAGLGRVGIAGLGAGLALTGLTIGAKTALSAFTALELQQTTYIGVLEATGYAAGKSADDIERLAEAIRHSTMATLGDVRAASAVLLTFRSVSGEAFDEALRLSQDLAAVGFGSITSAATMMGKALEDPIQGLTAMRRVGVTFSEQQKAMVKNFLETGQRAAAVEVVLKGVRNQVGGAGARQGNTLAGAWHQLSESTSNWLETTGETIAKALGISAAIRGIAGAIDAVNERAASLGTAAGQLQRLQELQAMGEKGLGPQIEAAKIRADVESVVNSYERLSLEMRTFQEGQQSAVDATQGAINKLKEEGEQLRRTALGQAIYNAVREASTGSQVPLDDAQKKIIENLARENFYLAQGAQLHGQRVAMLGKAASVEAQVAQKRREVNEAIKAGTSLYPREVDLILLSTRAEAEAARVAERAALGVASAQDAQRIATLELEVATRTYNLTAAEQAGALNALNRKYREVYESAMVARSALPELTRAGLDATNITKQLDTVGVSTFDNLASSITDVVTQSKTLGEAMRGLAQSVVKDLTQMIIKALVYRAVMSFLPGVGDKGSGSLFSFFGSAQGNVFRGGAVQPFARGGVVSQPVIFPMASGGLGLAGERGAEAIMPLKRLSNGNLGVEAGSGSAGRAPQINLVVNNHSGAEVSTGQARQNSNGSIDLEIIIGRVVKNSLLSDLSGNGPITQAHARRFGLDPTRGMT